MSKEQLEEESLLLEEVTNSEYPSYKEIVALNIRRKAGDKIARDEMITRNIKLAAWYARRRVGGDPNDSRFQDVFQEASIGLMKAVDRYDHNLGSSLGTYAHWYMRMQVNRFYYENGKTIRVNEHVQALIKKIKNSAHELQGELGRKPTVEEISDAVGMTINKVTELFLIPMGTKSLDEEMEGHDGDGGEFITVVADPNARTPSEIAIIIDDSKIAAEQLEDLLEHIQQNSMFSELGSETCMRMFSSRYGIFGCSEGEQTLETVGREFGISRERVRQICQKVFKMRAKLDLSLPNAHTLKRVVNNLRTAIEIKGVESTPLRSLWLAGVSSENNQESTANQLIDSDNSNEGIVRRLKSLAQQINSIKYEAEDSLVILAASRDFNVPEKDAAYILASSTDTTNIPELTLEELRSKYTLTILCSDPKAIWERQGKLFPTQIPEAKEKLIELRRKKGNVEKLIPTLSGIPVVIKESLCARYGLNGSEANVDDNTFAMTAEIRVQDVRQVLLNLWGKIKKAAGANAITSDEEYLQTVDRIEYWTLLIEE